MGGASHHPPKKKSLLDTIKTIVVIGAALLVGTCAYNSLVQGGESAIRKHTHLSEGQVITLQNMAARGQGMASARVEPADAVNCSMEPGAKIVIPPGKTIYVRIPTSTPRTTIDFNPDTKDGTIKACDFHAPEVCSSTDKPLEGLFDSWLFETALPRLP